MKYLITLLFALAIFACDDANNSTKYGGDLEEMRDGTDVIAAQTSAETQATTFLQQTVRTVQSAGGDITALAPAAATENITGWITRLSDVDGADGVVNGLGNLKQELMQESIDGGKVSEILSDLAAQTRAMGDKVPGLPVLAKVLDAGARKLAGK